jgi:small subunit ribosomal protein S15
MVVSAALLTLQIRGLNEHILANKKDVSNRGVLRQLIHDRAKVLRYVKRKRPDTYDTLLADIGVAHEAVEGELITRL